MKLSTKEANISKEDHIKAYSIEIKRIVFINPISMSNYSFKL
jgi:hypothetical protein